jgi:hypothetical protein
VLGAAPVLEHFEARIFVHIARDFHGMLHWSVSVPDSPTVAQVRERAHARLRVFQ